MKSQYFFSICSQLEKASISELTVFLTLAFICIVIYALSDYIRIAFLAFRTPGPKAFPLIGNCLVVKEKDRKLNSNFIRNLCTNTQSKIVQTLHAEHNESVWKHFIVVINFIVKRTLQLTITNLHR